jgi:release factor glutamine methyltransferase
MSVTVARALADARALGLARLDAQLLLSHHLQRTRTWLIAHDDAELDPAQARAFAADCRRRASGEPLAYLIGTWTFCGLELRVTPAVLVPRPETELLVDWALELLAGPLAAIAAPSVLDLGTGSGAIALALKQRWPAALVGALDVSPAALVVARANAERLGLEIDFAAGDWWSAARNRRFDLALANPPYIAAGDPHLESLRHEPVQALSPGGNGLGAVERIVVGAAGHLSPGGWLLLEHGHDQDAAVRSFLGAAGFQRLSTRRDLAGLARCSAGRWPG